MTETAKREPPADMSETRLIGTCYTCIREECLQPKHAKESPQDGCREGWTGGQAIDDIDEHWPCPDCDDILFIETANQHRCPAAGAELVA